MAKNRLRNLSGNTLVSTLSELLNEQEEFKQLQRTSGQSGILGYDIRNSAQWDLTGTVGTDSDSFDILTTFSVVFTGDGSQQPVLGNVSYEVYVNGTDSVHQLTPQTSSWTDGTRSASIEYSGVDENILTYTSVFTLVTLKAVTYYIKAFAVASSPGTLVVTT